MNICVKCGQDIERSECNLLACSNDLHASLQKCNCEICNCKHRSPNKKCNKCIRGIHKGEL